MATLQLRCKGCDQLFSSGIAKGLAGPPVLGVHAYKCPHCHFEATYSKEDYVDTAGVPA